MCGIFGFLGDGGNDQVLIKSFEKIKHRGPDNTETLHIDNVFLGFHRLSIMGLDTISNQPMSIGKRPSGSPTGTTSDNLGNAILCCNGEIYNYKELAQEHGFKLETHSDCEIIIHLYQKFGIEKTCQMLDGEFSFILYDMEKKELFVARDLLGLRGLFYGKTHNGWGFASEAKSLTFCLEVQAFMPRTWWSSKTQQFTKYYEFKPNPVARSIEEYCQLIREAFTRSVRKRVMMSDRSVGFLLSGGLDSSLCVALGVKCFENPKDVHTFSIGLKGSLDLKYAKIVADFLGTTHHSIELEEEEFLKEIPETIRVIESYDVTTVRASNAHRLIAKYVKEHTNIKVLISGEVSDELTCGYMAFGAISDPDELLAESIRMLIDIHLYDTLRADRAICCNGLEGRYPFAAKEFIQVYLDILPQFKSFYNKCRIEKYLLRQAFADQGLLPNEILWRRKDGFSDGISGTHRSTRVVLGEFINAQISNEDYERERAEYEYLCPQTKEQLYYRTIFDMYYPGRDTLIPGMWLPNPKYYGNITEPSGRILSTF